MRKLLALSMVAGMFGSVAFAGGASAAPSVSLVWQGSNTVVLGGSATLDVVVVSDTLLGVATTMVGIGDTSATAPKIIAATNTPPSPFGPVQFRFTPALPNSTQVGAFGGLAAVIGLGPGTYTLGSVTFQAGAATGSFAIDPFLRPGVDDEWIDPSGYNAVMPTLQGTALNVIPEPGTAALLGLGLVGLVAMRRRSCT